jgi:molybdate transport system ATP-binding protein
MSLDAVVGMQRGSLRLDVELTVGPGEIVALFGPNGAGKSTILRCLAGLSPIERGRVAIDDLVVDDPAAGVMVLPEHRPIGVVFQDYLLFAHLTALENVAFGLRARGEGKRAARRRAGEWLERLGLSGHADHKPAALSGGQAQRVALARALASDPRLLLLDEPLAALDAGSRGEMRRELRRHLASFDGMRLLVTHDPVDAYALADRVVVLEHGSVVQSGTLAEVTAHPRSSYVADLVGLNLLAGTLAGQVLTTTAGASVVTASDQPDGEAFAAIRPQAISLHLERPEGSPRNTWHCTVSDLDRLADRVRVTLAGPVPLVAEITPAALVALGLRPGDAVWAAVKASEVTSYPV